MGAGLGKGDAAWPQGGLPLGGRRKGGGGPPRRGARNQPRSAAAAEQLETDGCFPDPQYQRLVSTALTVYNDAILRVAIEHRLPVIDLRAVCAGPEDYSNPIEPASVGGEKIARVPAAFVTGSSTGGMRVIAA